MPLSVHESVVFFIVDALIDPLLLCNVRITFSDVHVLQNPGLCPADALLEGVVQEHSLVQGDFVELIHCGSSVNH